MSDKYFIKNIKRRNKSKDFLLSFNVVNLSNDPSLKDLTIKPIIKKKKNNNNLDSEPKKVNQGTNTIKSILKKTTTNKNKHNYFNIQKKKLFNDYEDDKYGEEWNCSTIRSNGKFQISNINDDKKNPNNNENKLYDNKQIVKKFILNNKHYISWNWKIKHNIIKYNGELNKEGFNISSHYLGNCFNNKFGITTNKFCINKNFILNHSKENMKFKNNYIPKPLILKKENEKNLKFITLNIPNNNYFNGMPSSNVVPKMKNVINSDKLYEKLINQMTIVFKNRIKKYSDLKFYEKQHFSKYNISNYNISKFNDVFMSKNNIFNVKQQKLFNDKNFEKEIERFKDKNIQVPERNNIFASDNKDKFKTFDMHNKYMKIKIRNANRENKFTNKTLSKDDMDMYIYKKK